KLFGVIVYIQNNAPIKRNTDNNADDDNTDNNADNNADDNNNDDNGRINNPTVEKVNTEFINSNLLAIDFLELFTPQKVVNRVLQRLSTLSDQEIDGFKFINEIADNHKLSITVGELAKYQSQEKENIKLKKELILIKNTLKSILTLVNTPTPF
ncbi:MAG: hypothetical protein II005_10345, partial [Turicibacter sp.]|nr:hypothetical protein [Turicibacter sp.]